MTARVEEIRSAKVCPVCIWAGGSHSSVCPVFSLLTALAQTEDENKTLKAEYAEMLSHWRERLERERGDRKAERDELARMYDEARAEVERLKAQHRKEISEVVSQAQYVTEKAEADLARVRAALAGIVKTWDRAELDVQIDKARAALEGR